MQRGRGRAAARQDPAAAHPAAGARGGRAGGRADARRVRPARRRIGPAAAMAAASGVSLSLGAAHLARARPAAAPGAALQAVQRSALRRQTARHRRPLSRPAGPRLVLSVDEKSQIQALDRTQPGLPLKKGRCRHDDARLHAQRHHHPVRRAQRARRQRHRPVHGSVTATRSSSASSTRSRPRCPPASWSMPSSTTTPPTSTPRSAPGSPAIRAGPSTSRPPAASWLNAVEGFFAKLARRRLKRGVFHSLVDLQEAINRFVAEANRDPSPSVWTKDPTPSSPRSAEGTKRWRQTTSAQRRPPSGERDRPPTESGDGPNCAMWSLCSVRRTSRCDSFGADLTAPLCCLTIRFKDSRVPTP